MKRTLAGLLAGLTLMGCSTLQPKGHIDLSYVPHYVDDQIIENAFKLELESGLETSIKGVDVYGGGRSRTYMTKAHSVWFEPFRQEYDVFLQAQKDNLTFYATHTCSHPVSREELQYYDKNLERDIILNYDGITEFGIKYRW